MASDFVPVPNFDLGSFEDIFDDNNIKLEWLDESFDLSLGIDISAFDESVKTVGLDDGRPKSRCAEMDESELDSIIQQSRSRGTQKNTTWGVKILRHWLEVRGERKDFESMVPEILNGILKRFYAEVRNPDGKHYSKSSCVGLRAAIHRHIRSPPFERQIDILEDGEFLPANNMFTSMLRQN